MRALKGGNKNDNIRVAVRLRPPLESEIAKGNTFEKLKIDQKAKMIR